MENRKKRWYECLGEKYYNYGFLIMSLNANTGQSPQSIDLDDITAQLCCTIERENAEGKI